MIIQIKDLLGEVSLKGKSTELLDIYSLRLIIPRVSFK